MGQIQSMGQCLLPGTCKSLKNGAPGRSRTSDRLVRSVPPETAYLLVISYLYATSTVQ
jgi:hypothetical protein